MLKTIEAAARKAGEGLLTSFHQHLHAKEKTNHQNLVSKADFNSQKYIRDFLLKNLLAQGIDRKNIGFLGEEGLDEKGEYTFIIDPLDGTTNFISGIEYFAVSIACLQNGELLCGVTYNPVTDTLYIAEKGNGAFKVHGWKRRSYIYEKFLSENPILIPILVLIQKSVKNYSKLQKNYRPKFVPCEFGDQVRLN